MNPRERVAEAYLRQCSEVTFIEQNIGNETRVSARSTDGGEVGRFRAYVDLLDRESISEYECAEEMLELIDANPDLDFWEGRVYVVEVFMSRVDRSFQGKRCGLEGYLRLAQHVLRTRSKGKPFLFIPNQCSYDSDATSDSALRVWDSLSRSYKSKGRVILFDR